MGGLLHNRDLVRAGAQSAAHWAQDEVPASRTSWRGLRLGGGRLRVLRGRPDRSRPEELRTLLPGHPEPLRGPDQHHVLGHLHDDRHVPRGRWGCRGSLLSLLRGWGDWCRVSSAAPAASALTAWLSQRVVIMIGGLLCTSGMLLASLDLSLPWLYFSMGILEGTNLITFSSFTHLYYFITIENKISNTHKLFFSPFPMFLKLFQKDFCAFQTTSN